MRAATERDLDAIVAMGLRFQASTTYAMHLRATDATLRAFAIDLLANPGAVIWLAVQGTAVVGMLAAIVYPQPMSGVLVGTELCWWMDPSARGGRTALRLIRQAEDWARAKGATVFQMMAPTARVGAFYQALHYDAVETLYQRVIA